MGKISMEWNLTNDDGGFEREDMMRCVKSLDMTIAVSTIIDNIKSRRESFFDNENDSPEELYNDCLSEVIDMIYETLEDFNIDLDELLS